MYLDFFLHEIQTMSYQEYKAPSLEAHDHIDYDHSYDLWKII